MAVAEPRHSGVRASPPLLPSQSMVLKLSSGSQLVLK